MGVKCYACQATPKIIDDVTSSDIQYTIAFSIHKIINDDQKVFLIGNHINLGNLKTENAVQMLKDDENIWRVNINLKPNNYSYRFFLGNSPKNKFSYLTRYKELNVSYFKFLSDESYNNERLLNIMSFNLRYSTKKDKEDAWDHRKEGVVSLIMNYRPDVLGIQEGLPEMIDYLKKNLSLYKYWGRSRSFLDEQCGIFYRKNMFLKVDGGHFWLSNTPEVSGSRSFGNNHVRMCSFVKLKYKRSDFIMNDLIFYNTHLDHESGISRIESSKLILTKIKEFDKNPYSIVLLTGDFNTTPNDPCITSILNNDKVYLRSVNNCNYEGTFHGFQGSCGSLIDYIFHNNSLISYSLTVIKDKLDNGRYPSDHFPILARFNVNNDLKLMKLN